MPVVAAGIGFFTKIVATCVMFHALEFVGLKPYLGWQGVIPRRAHVMATDIHDMLTRRLLKPAEIFASLDPLRIQAEAAAEFEGVLRPVFQQHEWKLIAVRVGLGFLVGELQMFMMLHP